MKTKYPTLKKTPVRNPQPFTSSVVDITEPAPKPRRGRPRKAPAGASSR
jgi:hypothetical protein